MPPPSVALLILLTLVASASLEAQEVKARLTQLMTPKDPVEAVRSAFNAAKGKPRFIAVLSPT